MGRSQKAFPEGQEGSGGPLGGAAGVERSSRKAGMGREAHPKGREGSRGPTGGLGGREAHLQGLLGTRRPLRGPGENAVPSRRLERGWEALPVGQKG